LNLIDKYFILFLTDTEMKPQTLFHRVTQFSTIAALQAGFFFMIIPSHPLQARVGGQFQVCAEELEQAGLPSDQVAAACADALRPKDLSLCVLSMNQEAGVSAEEALFNCDRDRRPLELATCVLDLNEFLEVNDLGLIVENCRRSLLPLRYSECVVGLTNTPKQAIAPVEALDQCLSAEAFPESLTPIEQ